MKDKFDLTENKIIPMLNNLDDTTRDLAIDMLTMSVHPIETHPKSASIIQTLVQCANVDHTSDNPVIAAANVVREIYELAHGQQIDIESIIELLMMEYIEFVA